MHPALYALLGQQVRFRPLGAGDKHGQADFGPPTAPVPARISWPKAHRTQTGGRAESIDRAFNVYIDPRDFPDLVTAVPVGSVVIRPDGSEAVVQAVEAHYAPPVPEVPGIDGLSPGADAIDHFKVVAAP